MSEGTKVLEVGLSGIGRYRPYVVFGPLRATEITWLRATPPHPSNGRICNPLPVHAERVGSPDWLDGDVNVVAEPASVAKCRLEVSDVLLGLFEQWSQSLGYVGQLEFVRLGEPLSVAFQLLARRVSDQLAGHHANQWLPALDEPLWSGRHQGTQSEQQGPGHD